MIDYILLTKILLGVWFWCKFEPIQDGIDLMWGKIPEKLSSNYFVDHIYVALGCMKCLSLWTTLIITGDILLSIGNSMLSELIKKILN